jgi:hypothetical protein
MAIHQKQRSHRHDCRVAGKPMRRIRYWTICGILSLVTLAGCGRSGPELAPVSGRVMLDGEPLFGARLMFQPEATGSPSYGSTGRDGRYQLGYKRGVKGAMIGWHIVRIQLDTEISGSNGKATQRPKSLPARYNTRSELRREVQPGENNVIDFELTSAAK